MEKIQRCSWAQTDNQLLRDYHDKEWGRPCHEDQKLFELLSLEMMQAGLSWQTILNKRAAFNQAFAHFDFQTVQYFEPKLPELMANRAIVRNRRKLLAIINNAKIIARQVAAGQSFNDYVWHFVDNTPIKHAYTTHEEVPSTTPVAKAMSQQMKKDGFAFAGPVTVYSFMQAAGLVNDHETACFLYNAF